MIFRNCRSVYFLGIGGIGMSALARYFSFLGARIYGYDKTPTSLTKELEAEGMAIHFEENVDLIPDEIDLVIYTPAIPQENKEFLFFLEKNIQVKKRSEVLGMITREFSSLAVAGTHGKTTTSALITHILKTAGTNMVAFLGGISKNYNTNFLIKINLQETDQQFHDTKKYAVVEADEFDRSFLQLNPQVAIITSMDDDHLDIYKNSVDLREAFMEFGSKIRPGGSLIYKKGLPLESLKKKEISVKTYSLEAGSDYYPRNVRNVNGLFEFDLVTPDHVYEKITLGLPGRFNLENAIAALGLVTAIGIREEDIREAMKTYHGVKRRFDFQILTDDLIYIDDYAHHPEEIKACIRAVKEIYPLKKITGVFQPHLFSRTRDLADAFARSLELLDEVILLEIYPAREKPIPGINSQMLLDKIDGKHKMLCTKENFLSALKVLNPEVLLTMGAGDIDQWPDKIVRIFGMK
jgi:UDP-N-acetylmuramate--alanine ligase